MCIAYIEFQPNHPFPLRIAANRDEFHRRPAQLAHYWKDSSGILAGRDLEAGGSWLGMHPDNKRFALITNYREPERPAPQGAISRGRLVQEFLTTQLNAQEFLNSVEEQSDRYAGFNLVLGEHLNDPCAALWYYSNRAAQKPLKLSAGSYVLSNHLLNTPWPKTKRLKKLMFEAFKANTLHEQIENGLKALCDNTQAPVENLPNTGLSQEMESLLSSIFIVSPDYGSRCSTVILLTENGQGVFCEQSYAADGLVTDRIDWPLQLRPNNR